MAKGMVFGSIILALSVVTLSAWGIKKYIVPEIEAKIEEISASIKRQGRKEGVKVELIS